MESQNKEILKSLKDGNKLTQIDAFELFKCWRLAARIKNLRDDGHQIHTEIVTLPNKKRIAYYSLIKEAPHEMASTT